MGLVRLDLVQLAPEALILLGCPEGMGSEAGIEQRKHLRALVLDGQRLRR